MDYPFTTWEAFTEAFNHSLTDDISYRKLYYNNDLAIIQELLRTNLNHTEGYLLFIRAIINNTYSAQYYDRTNIRPIIELFWLKNIQLNLVLPYLFEVPPNIGNYGQITFIYDIVQTKCAIIAYVLDAIACYTTDLDVFQYVNWNDINIIGLQECMSELFFNFENDTDNLIIIEKSQYVQLFYANIKLNSNFLQCETHMNKKKRVR